MKKNRITICGRNTTTEPTPDRMPSVNRSRASPSPIEARTCSVIQPIAASSASANGVAQVKTAWKTTNSKAKRISGPAHGCRNSRSSLACMRWRLVSETIAASAMAWAVTRRSVSVVWGRGCSGLRSSAAAMAAASSASPRRRTATVAMTGTPRASCKAAGSITRPSRSARSSMLSATTVGRPSAITSWAKTRCCSRFEASSTTTSTCGAGSPGNSPRMTLRVTSSSGLVAFRP